jgi:hypothetical protein
MGESAAGIFVFATRPLHDPVEAQVVENDDPHGLKRRPKDEA